jgi:hypothetical protein
MDNLQVATEVTDENGEVLLWLDHELLGLEARYDFEVAPPDFSNAPRWTIEQVDVAVSRNGDGIDLGDLVLPRASYARGELRDTNGALVPGAEIRWFALPDAASCATGSCSIPARSVGIWESDENGTVVSVLPDP